MLKICIARETYLLYTDIDITSAETILSYECFGKLSIEKRSRVITLAPMSSQILLSV